MSEWMAERELQLAMEDGSLNIVKLLLGTPHKKQNSPSGRW
jgi:hypothetical protein